MGDHANVPRAAAPSQAAFVGLIGVSAPFLHLYGLIAKVRNATCMIELQFVVPQPFNHQLETGICALLPLRPGVAGRI